MKKKAAAIIIAALVITLGGTTAFAFTHNNPSYVQEQKKVSEAADDTRYVTNSVCGYCRSSGHCFNDSDGDGICDYYKTDTSLNNNGSHNICHGYGTSHHSEQDHNYNYSQHHAGHGYWHR